MKLHITPLAENDIAEIWAYIAMDNIAAANAMEKKLRAMAEKLAEFPGLGPRRDDLLPGLRTFPVGNYLIGYSAIGETLEVLRIIHGMRRLEWLFRK